jgi:hypothetical protein
MSFLFTTGRLLKALSKLTAFVNSVTSGFDLRFHLRNIRTRAHLHGTACRSCRCQSLIVRPRHQRDHLRREARAFPVSSCPLRLFFTFVIRYEILPALLKGEVGTHIRRVADTDPSGSPPCKRLLPLLGYHPGPQRRQHRYLQPYYRHRHNASTFSRPQPECTRHTHLGRGRPLHPFRSSRAGHV